MRAIDYGETIVGIEIPVGFQSDLASDRGAWVQVILHGATTNTATIAQGYAHRFVEGFALQRTATYLVFAAKST